MWNDLTTFESSLDNIKNKYQRLTDRCERLEEENDRLKEEHYKDNELKRLKEDYDNLYKDYIRGFPITDKQKQAIQEWYKSHKCRGYLKYSFTPTCLGTSGKVICSCGKEYEFQPL